MEKLKIGRASLTWLKGGVVHVDEGAIFGVVPKSLWSRRYPDNDTGRIELRTDPILLQIEDKNYLIDSGIGVNKFTDKQRRNFGILEQSFVTESLHELGLRTKDIDGILMTHLHYDHANGLTMKQDDGSYSATYPGVPIFTSAVEWEEMRHPNVRSKNTYWKENWEPIVDQVHTFIDEIYINDYIKMVHTGGHSDGHSIIVFEDGNDCFIHMGDIMPTHGHQDSLWVMAFDDYPMTSIYQKEKWMEYGYEREAWYIFYHDAYYRALKFNKHGEIVEKLERKR